MNNRKKKILLKIPIEQYRLLNKRVLKIQKGENTSETITSYINRLIYNDNQQEQEDAGN